MEQSSKYRTVYSIVVSRQETNETDTNRVTRFLIASTSRRAYRQYHEHNCDMS